MVLRTVSIYSPSIPCRPSFGNQAAGVATSLPHCFLRTAPLAERRKQTNKQTNKRKRKHCSYSHPGRPHLNPTLAPIPDPPEQRPSGLLCGTRLFIIDYYRTVPARPERSTHRIHYSLAHSINLPPIKILLSVLGWTRQPIPHNGHYINNFSSVRAFCCSPGSGDLRLESAFEIAEYSTCMHCTVQYSTWSMRLCKGLLPRRRSVTCMPSLLGIGFGYCCVPFSTSLLLQSFCRSDKTGTVLYSTYNQRPSFVCSPEIVFKMQELGVYRYFFEQVFIPAPSLHITISSFIPLMIPSAAKLPHLHNTFI